MVFQNPQQIYGQPYVQPYGESYNQQPIMYSQPHQNNIFQGEAPPGFLAVQNPSYYGQGPIVR